ncbi:hypothetical protein PL321_10460 [Caloramator sp. mosi_1]|uniref:hypothetical protein n=1 Tax=Caloramator sp. mosi_1 TaxID=3023090 RepID=UPI00235F1794|nr:hypothetical protein [Caloramator sp. mosi_1]WDC83217.1 hypothetical protein PL321_10460 [Caloramator sp. mosi_1]
MNNAKAEQINKIRKEEINKNDENLKNIRVESSEKNTEGKDLNKKKMKNKTIKKNK